MNKGEWTHEIPAGSELRKQKKYWLKKMLDLQEEEPLLSLSVPRMELPFKIHKAESSIPSELGERLFRMSGNSPEALYLIILAALKCLIHRYTDGSSVTVACPNRIRIAASSDLSEAQWIPLIDKKPGKSSFREWLNEVRDTYTEAVRNADFQMDKVIADMKVIHDRDYSFLRHIRLGMRELHGEMEANIEADVTGLLIEIELMGEHLHIKLCGSSRYWPESTVDRLAAQFIHLLQELTAYPDRPAAECSWLSEEERKIVLDQYASGQPMHSNGNVIEMFEAQVLRTPNAEAIITPEEVMNYSGLNQRVNRWANALNRKGIHSGEAVALFLDRGSEAAVAILTVLKIGACFLPADINSPGERIRFMFADAGVKRVITQHRYADNPLFSGIEVIECEDLDAEWEEREVYPPVTGESPAYIIYTSGTTGTAKGVAVSHRGLANSIHWRREEYRLDEHDRTIQLFSYSFDGFLTAFFTPLVSGANVFMANEIQVKDPLRLKQLLIVHQITHFICVPALYRLLLEQIKENDGLRLRIVTLAGERITPVLVRESRCQLPDVEIVNEYGPTETSIVALCKREVYPSEPIAIGRPIANMKAYLLDDRLEPVPRGIAGELCLSGPGLAEGYLNRPDLTAQAFVPHPFIPGERIYRTGDMGKWTEDGEIICLGRKDAQVKLRGYRIELSEIESRLAAYPGVQSAAVLCEEEDGVPARIVAYLECDSVQAKELREQLRSELPHYMIPARYFRVERMPLSENGKIDRKSLLLLEDPADLDAEIREPENETERRLSEIFSDVLQVSKVSTDVSFFHAGGHSLKATMLMSRIHKTFGVEIGIDDIFELQTIRALAASIAEQGTAAYHPVTPAAPAGDYPLTSAQKRMYALQNLEPQSVAYNMPEALIVEGDLDQERLSDAVCNLIKRHEVLRTTFKMISGEPIQVIHDEYPFILDVSTPQTANPETEISRFMRPFDLGALPLFRIGLRHLGNRKHLLLIDLHHIISDGASVGLFIKELAELYNGQALTEAPLQYKDYAVWQLLGKERDEVKQQEKYWLEQFETGVPVLNLPYDYSRPKLKSMKGSRVSFTIDAARTASLKKAASGRGATLFMILLSAYHLLLAKLSGQEDIVIGSPVSGRTQAELEMTMGMFVNVVPLRNMSSQELTFTSFLEAVKRSTLGAFEHQAFQLEDLAHSLGASRDPGRSPLFDTMFVLQNMPENRFDFRGLHFTHYGIEHSVSKFDLTLAGFEGGDGILYFDLEYCSHLFAKQTVEHFTDYFKHIVQTVLDQPGIRLSDITLLQREQLLQHWSSFGNVHAAEQPVLTFPEQVICAAERYPHHDALRMGESRMTYSTLVNRVEQRANGLIRSGIGSQMVVAVRLERSFEMIISFLAVLRSGAVYLPIDPAFPAERAEYMLQDARAALLITDQDEDQRLAFDGETILISELDGPASSLDIPVRRPQMNSLAYIIYTSGTTGKPKGTALEHGGLANLPFYFQSSLGVGPDDRIIQFAPCTFDASIWEFVMALSAGATLCLIPKETIGDPEQLEQYAEELCVTVATLPPAYMARLRPEHLPGMRLIITAGSEPSAVLLSRWCLHMRVVNAYGPTEASVCATACEVTEDLQSAAVPLGTPIPNVRICIVDSAMNLLPPGVTGELCISGIGLAREYLNQPEITARQFVTLDMPGFERMYRTGDLVKQLTDGSILYLGRADNQLKIRGCRVEPREVEAQLLRMNGVESAAVLPKRQSGGEQVLAAYYTGDSAPEPKEIKALLTGRLPDYMVPVFILKLSALPLTRNGKIDTEELQRLSVNGPASDIFKRPPANDYEAAILNVFRAVLDTDGIGPDDHFSEHGGDSLSAMKAVFLLKEKELFVEVRDLLLQQTAAALSHCVLQRLSESSFYEPRAGQTKSDSLKQSIGNDTGVTPELTEMLRLLEDQQQDYAACLHECTVISHIPVNAVQAMHLQRSENVGAVIPVPLGLSLEDIRLAVLRIIQEQDMLRVFLAGENRRSWVLLDRPKQIILPFIKVRGAAAGEQMKQLIHEQYYTPFDYDIPGSLLYRFALIETNNNKVLVYASHHALSDGLSCSLIAESLFQQSPSAPAGRPATGYPDFVRLLENGPQDISLMELEQRFELLSYRQLIPELEHKISHFQKGSSSFSLNYKLSSDQPEDGWHTVLQLLMILGREFLQMDRLPVRLISAGRRYGRETFYHVAGNFTDYIPLVLSAAEPAGQTLHRIRNLTQAAGDHFIRFADLEDNAAEQGIMLNYFGAMQADKDEEWMPEGGPSIDEMAAHYGISCYVRHEENMLKVHIALPFQTDVETLKLRLADNALRESLS
jgi:amino acid adenylation domain-containing protein